MIQPWQSRVRCQNDYPTSDGKPMAETDLHRILMNNLIETLKLRFENDQSLYISGNLLIFYQEGNRRLHVSPDVFVVAGVGNHTRDNYLLWEEGNGQLDLVIEVTSKTTKKEDIETKYQLYQSRLGVNEYFLFAPFEEYMQPSFQGYRRVKDAFRPMKPLAGRFTSKVLGLQLERTGQELRFRDPVTGTRLPTILEQMKEERTRAEIARSRADQAEEEVKRLRAIVEKLRRQRRNRP